MQETSKEKGKVSMLGEQRRDVLINGYCMQKKCRFQSITKQMLISIGNLTLKVKISQKQHVYKIPKAYAQ